MTVITFSLALYSFASLLAYPLLRRFGRNGFFALAAVPAIAFCALATYLPQTFNGEAVSEHYAWIPQFSIDITFRIDLFTNLLALLVTGAGALILFYCARYFQVADQNVPRFGAVFTAFAAVMLGLVIADNVFLLFIFWEATTVFSFLLIAHNGKKRTGRVAAAQAIIITTIGGLAMLVGLIILVFETGEANLSAIIAAAPSSTAAAVAVFLLLAGALSKSAIFPFHFWLPQAMAAPTPVSAYLHAAAMVKAGVLLVALLGPAFGDIPGYRATLVILGAVTMLLGGIRALRQTDLKLVLAFGTVSQLGMLVMLYGVAIPAVDAAATALLFAHAVAKAPLFLSVGLIEHYTGTRDLRRISGLGKQVPLLATVAVLATLSMIGFPPLIGFVAKEAALTELMHHLNDPYAPLVLGVLVAGSVLTVAYMLRFAYGAFATKKGVAEVEKLHDVSKPMLFSAAVFSALALFGGIFSNLLDPIYQRVRPTAETIEHFALWHGITPALGTTVAVLVVGALLIPVFGVGDSRLPHFEDRFSAPAFFADLFLVLDRVAVWITALTQRGSLPFYLAVTLTVASVGVGGHLLLSQQPLVDTYLGSPVQAVIAAVLIIASVATLLATKRFQAAILVGFAGYAMAALFALHGAPDLALTQMLVETLTLIAFVLVIRRLPQRLSRREKLPLRIRNIFIGSAMAIVLGVFALTALGARIHTPVSVDFAELAVSGGHGKNIVNVTLVDIRGWDTFGELSVVIAAATGIASLVFLFERGDNLPKISRRDARSNALHKFRQVVDPQSSVARGNWMLAGSDLSPERRSIVLEVVVRLIFHILIILSIYMLLAGHNSPGGGFAGGLIAGMAVVARYLTGGRTELGATVPFDAGRIVGIGMIIAALTVIAPMLFGQAALTSNWIDLDLGIFGELALVTSTVFDIGVYLIVFGLVLDVVRSLGAQIDVHTESDRQVTAR